MCRRCLVLLCLGHLILDVRDLLDRGGVRHGGHVHSRTPTHVRSDQSTFSQSNATGVQSGGKVAEGWLGGASLQQIHSHLDLQGHVSAPMVSAVTYTTRVNPPCDHRRHNTPWQRDHTHTDDTHAGVVAARLARKIFENQPQNTFV